MSSSLAAEGAPGRALPAPGTPTLYVDRLESPLGDLLVAADHLAVYLVEFAERTTLQSQLDALARELGCTFQDGGCGLTEAAGRQLQEYFAGGRQVFDLPIATPGSRLQQQVWRRIATIPYGETASYGAIAQEIRRPLAHRAVGRATGQNRLALLVPCHRVVGANGALTGYAAGIAHKRWLLDHERSAGGELAHPSS